MLLLFLSAPSLVNVRASRIISYEWIGGMSKCIGIDRRIGSPSSENGPQPHKDKEKKVNISNTLWELQCVQHPPDANTSFCITLGHISFSSMSSHATAPGSLMKLCFPFPRRSTQRTDAPIYFESISTQSLYAFQLSASEVLQKYSICNTLK